MGYAIHIMRRNFSGQTLPIALSEWRAVVEQTTGVRMANDDFKATNPKTAKVIKIQDIGDVEVFFPADSTWRRVFYWSPPGRVSFRASSDFEQPSSIISRLAASLARDLNASLIGDEGEIYLFRCPCCGFRTLSERSSWEICAVCWWEDDGQDDPNADEVWGGPNDKYSLSAARANFLSHGHMYDQGKGIRVVERPSPERSSLLEYVRSVLSGQEDLDDGKLQEMINADRTARGGD